MSEQILAASFGTLSLDLLTPSEEEDYEILSDVPRLAARLEVATDWIRQQSELKFLPLGYFGSQAGAAAALWAAAELGPRVHAVVCAAGRPDLAYARLRAVRAPTLLIVGDQAPEVLTINRDLFTRLERAKLSVIPGGSQLSEEKPRR